MKIGKGGNPASSIATANAETIVVRGFDLCKDLIGQVSLTEHFWLLVTGQRASTAQGRVLDACMVAISEHGLVPSVQAARMTYAAGPEAMQGAVAAGILGCGSVILGSREAIGNGASARFSDFNETKGLAIMKWVDVAYASFMGAEDVEINPTGARREGILRNHYIMPDGVRRDSVYYSVIEKEWPGVKRRLEGWMDR